MPDLPPDPGAVADQPTALRPVRARRVRSGAGAPPLVLQPLSPSAILDAAFTVVRHRFGALVGMAALLTLPAVALGAAGMFDGSGLVWWDVVADELERLDPFVVDPGEDERVALALFSFVAQVVATFATGVVVATVVSNWYAGVELRWTEALRRTGARTLAILAAVAIGAALRGVGLLVCGIGVILPMAWFLVTAPAMAVEQLGPVAATRRAATLSARHFVHVLGTVLGASLVAELLRASLVLLPFGLLSGMPDGARQVSQFLLVWGVTALLTAYAAAVATVTYLELRVRSEGLDLELEATDVLPVDAP
ncbi:MAG: hypothetical protein JJU45_09405 [Acidimicrobiia bacterium]|nr:hypothetical protein [Acidimicrobiia bacterium]